MAEKLCSKAACTGWAYCRGLCSRHYMRLRRGGGLPSRVDCKVDGCTRTSYAQGWCDAHYRRARRYGSPLAVRVPGRQGERNGNARLTADDVRAIREALAAGEKQAVIAARFGITNGYVSQIHRGRTWRSVPAVAS